MQVYCILGDERALRSKSPVIFSTVIEKLGIKGAYVPFKVAPGQIGKALDSMRILNIAGANITVPYKEAVVPHLDILSEGANIIGAINTIVRNGDILKGYNTNAIGFMDALNDARFDVENKTALVFGTGGAARAVVFVLNWLRTHSIIVAGRNENKTMQMVSRFGGEAKAFKSLSEQPINVDLIVNATSVSISTMADVKICGRIWQSETTLRLWMVFPHSHVRPGEPSLFGPACRCRPKSF